MAPQIFEEMTEIEAFIITLEEIRDCSLRVASGGDLTDKLYLLELTKGVVEQFKRALGEKEDITLASHGINYETGDEING